MMNDVMEDYNDNEDKDEDSDDNSNAGKLLKIRHDTYNSITAQKRQLIS